MNINIENRSKVLKFSLEANMTKGLMVTGMEVLIKRHFSYTIYFRGTSDIYK